MGRAVILLPTEGIELDMSDPETLLIGKNPLTGYLYWRTKDGYQGRRTVTILSIPSPVVFPL